MREDSRRRPASPYGLSKLAAEELVGLYARERGVPATVLRYFTVYGPRQRPDMALSRFISAAVRDEALKVFGDGNQLREMTYVSDVVEATVAALEALPGGPYNVGGGARSTVNELIDHVQRAGNPGRSRLRSGRCGRRAVYLGRPGAGRAGAGLPAAGRVRGRDKSSG